MGHADGAGRGQPVHAAAADQHRAGTQRQRFQNIGTAADAAVNQQRHLRPDPCGNLRQGIQGCRCAIQNPAAMV